MIIYSILTIVFLAILSLSLYLWGYNEGKAKGLQEGRKDLADYVLREKVRS
ncbi:hypothetical protein Metlim_2386 [Methanoplanus limicola DSM 2279]|uniref:Uncharacterized protein n=1 Tax=Methanoplanus limicola DSM 2279 TaxID=937775 RepID=H1Z2N4_9EURY|nr:hypothetical protein Metlim_2386 [Methanoplanus limicola DSM 2279]